MLCFSVSPNVHFLLLKEAVPESCALVVHYLQTVHSSPRTELAAPKVCMTSINNMGKEGRGREKYVPGQVVFHPPKSPLFSIAGQSCFPPT